MRVGERQSEVEAVKKKISEMESVCFHLSLNLFLTFFEPFDIFCPFSHLSLSLSPH